MNLNLEFTKENESALQAKEGQACISQLRYKEDKGTFWFCEGYDIVTFNGTGTNVVFKLGRYIWVQILEWTNPVAILERSVKFNSFLLGLKAPYILTFADTKSRDDFLTRVNDVISQQKLVSNMLIDVPATYYSDIDTEGIEGVFNATKDGIIYMTPKIISFATLLINTKAYHQISPEALGDDMIKMNNININTQNSFPIRVKFQSNRDDILAKLQEVIKSTDINIDITAQNPVSFKQEEEANKDDEDGDKQEEGESKFTEFPAILLESLTGEENDEILFTDVVKIYIMDDSKWLCLGFGDFHINYTSDGKYRMTMRRGPNRIVTLNQYIFKEMRPTMHADCIMQFIGYVNMVQPARAVLIRFSSVENLEIVDFLMQNAINPTEK